MGREESALAYLAKLPMAIAGAGGHQATFKAALACRRFGLTHSEMAEAMRWFNKNRCRPPWSEKELAHKVESAMALGVARPLGQARRAERTFVTPSAPIRRPAPVIRRSVEAEDAWWQAVAETRGACLEAWDAERTFVEPEV